MNRKIKRLLSVLLCLALCVSLLPAAVFATEDEPLDPPAEAEVTETPAEPEVAETPDDPEPTETPDEPEPTETPDEPEPTEVPVEPEPTETPDAEERAEITAVRVYFICTPEAAVVRVWAAPAEGGEPDESAVIAPGADGAYLLAPGAYLYTVSCEGYASVELQPLAVEAREDALNVEIALEALAAEGESGEEIASAEAQNSIVLSGSCGENVSFTLDDEGLLTISGTGAMENYQYEESSPWYSKRSSVKTAVIESGVTSVGERAFQDCGLTSVTIPASVTSIGDYAFQGCGDLTSIALPAGVTSIGGYAFDTCASLRAVTLPDSLESMGEAVFFDCSSLAGITIPAGVTAIEGYSFNGCGALESVTIPAGLLNVGDAAFEYCTALSTVYYGGTQAQREARQGSGWSEARNDPFFNAAWQYNSSGPVAVTGVTLDMDSMELSIGAVQQLTATVSPADAADPAVVWSSSNGTVAAVDQTGLVTAVAAGSATITVTTNDGGFTAECAVTVGIVLSGSCGKNVSFTLDDEGLLTISGTGAMSNYTSTSNTRAPWNNYCSDIQTVVIESGVTSIGNSAFYNCSALTSVTIPEGVTSIGNSAFYNCSALTSVTIPEGVTSIGSYAFYSCSSLTSVTIPASVTSVGNCAFQECESLRSVLISDLTKWCAVSFGIGTGYPFDYAHDLYLNGTLIEDLVIPEGVTSIGVNAFQYCASLTSVTISDDVISIGDGAFSHCTALTSITIPESITSISKDAFFDCSSLTSVTIPSSVTSIGDEAFSDCSNLADVYYNGTRLQWDAITKGNDNAPLTGATIHCTAIASGTCGDDLTWLLTNEGELSISGTGAMADYSAERAPWYSYIGQITSLTIPEGVTSIGSYAFYSCSSLTSVTIPASISSIEVNAFYECSSLTEIIFEGSRTQWSRISVASGNECLSDASVTFSAYTVSFDSNGGEGAPEEQTEVFGTSINLSEIAPSYPGYEFLGWATDPDAAEAEYQPGDEYTAEEDATLYALWSLITYTIRFNGNGNTGGATASIQTTADDAEVLLPNGFFKTYYTFAAWNTAADKTGEAFGETAVTLDLIEFANEQNEVTLYAQWELLHYSIAFEANGGDGEMDPMAMQYSAPRALTPNSFTRAGYAFSGWNTKANGKGTSFADRATVNNLAEQEDAVVTLYAQWKANKYTVAFDANSGTGTMAAQTMTYGKAAAFTANAFKKANWQFVGWSEDPNATEPTYANKQTVRNLTAEPGGTVTLYAVWVKNSYRIVFKANGGTGDMSEESAWYEYDGSYILPLCAFERPGFEFQGWATSAKGKVVYTDGQQIEGLTKTNGKVITLYAKWKTYHYSIRFDGNGATSGSTKAMNGLACGKAYTLTANGFKKTGYTFAGWNTQPDGSGTAYANKAKRSNFCTGDGDELVLCAQWTPTEYRIAYKNVAASDGNTNPPSYKITDETIELQSLSRPGCHFEGWYLDAKYKIEVTQIPAGSTGALTLYAKWSGTAYTYRVVFEPNCGTGTMAEEVMTCGKAKALTANAFKRAGYTFAGWNTHLDGSGERYENKQSVLNLSENENGTVWLYAQWTAINYKITYKGVCAFDTNNNPATYSLTDPVDFSHLNNPARSGCDFGGWYTDAKCTKPAATATFSATGAKTLYAKWLTKASYKIVFDANAEGVKGTMKPLTKRVNGTVYTLTANAFKRTGYRFLGWSTDPNAAEPTYANKAKVGNLAEHDGDTVTLYAIWEPIEYRITYRNVVGARVPGKDTYTIEETYELPIPEKEGYIFLGWYTGASFKTGTRIWQIGPGSTGNKTLYAKWMQRTQ